MGRLGVPKGGELSGHVSCWRSTYWNTAVDKCVELMKLYPENACIALDVRIALFCLKAPNLPILLVFLWSHMIHDWSQDTPPVYYEPALASKDGSSNRDAMEKELQLHRLRTHTKGQCLYHDGVDQELRTVRILMTWWHSHTVQQQYCGSTVVVQQPRTSRCTR